MQIQPYLYFAGGCEDALHFYKSIFGGEVSGIFRYAGTPMAHDLPEGWSEKIMHATFQSGDLTFMAADTPSQPAGGSNACVRLSVVSLDHDEGLRVFEALGAGGTVIVPYEKQFWGASFGMLTDKYGIPWMVNAG
jgi:PhnB protein